MPVPAISLIDAGGFAILIVVVLSAVGEALYELLNSFLKVGELDLDLPRRVILDFAVGSAFISLLGMTFTYLSVSFNFLVFAPVMAAGAMVLRIIISFQSIRKRFIGYVRSARASTWAVPLFLLGVGIATFFARVVPLSGNFVYSGRDVTWYTLITERVSQEGHFTGWGGFASPAWNVGVDPHLLFEGFHAITVLFLRMTPLGAPQTVSYTAIVFNAYVPLAIYFLARTVSKSEIVGIGSALIIAFISPYPAFFLLWGGVAEIANWVIVPVAIALLTKAKSMKDSTAWLCVILVSGSIIIHPISSVYLFGFAFAMILADLVEHRVRHVITIMGVTSSAVLIVIPFLINAYVNVSVQAAGLPPGTFGWEGFKSKVLISPSDLGSSWSNLLTFTTGWAYAPVAVISGLLGAVSASREKWSRYLIGWLAVLVILNENGPFGLYLIPFPFWWMLFPERFALAAFMPLAIFSAKLVLEVSDKLSGVSPRFPHLFHRRQLLLGAFAIISLVAVQNYAVIATSVAMANPVTSSDMAAFQWMKENLPSNSTVLVNDADSGWWVPAFTGIRAFGVDPMITSPQVRGEADHLKGLITTEPNSLETLQLMKKYGITHVFFGAKTIYGLPSENVTSLLAPAVPPIYHVMYEVGPVFIFKVEWQYLSSYNYGLESGGP